MATQNKPISSYCGWLEQEAKIMMHKARIGLNLCIVIRWTSREKCHKSRCSRNDMHYSRCGGRLACMQRAQRTAAAAP
eukprot:6180473-Pleurochrysis_carterae.AAC.3